MAAAARSRDPGGKLTLFDLFEWVVALGGCAVGFAVGYKRWGWIASVILALAGLWVGAIVGRIPAFLALRALSLHLRKQDTAALREKLDSEPYISHFVVRALRKRGEPDAGLQKKMLSRLLLESAEMRWQAWRTVNLCFPDLAQRLRGIDPREPPERYEGLVRNVMASLPEAPAGTFENRDSHAQS